MSLQIHNTLTRTKEEFVPLQANQVKMYVCGVTVYDECHLGHARALVNFDVIYRYLQHKGFQVKYVRNYTDVDDKITNRAHKEKVAWDEIASRYIQAFDRDMLAIGNVTPTLQPKATEHISQMIEIIQKLIEKGYAYEVNGNVFYSVRKKNDYGKLSGKKIDELEAGARVEIYEAKKDPLDFALWKASKPGEPSWPSPWGLGRPGWHIECSAMSIHYLGDTFDIHGGGRDLIFPHHENEMAQSEGSTDKLFARYWIHNGFVNINAEEMSKSLGNFLTIQEILKQYHAEVLRFFILSAHYRSPLDYTEQNMEVARQSLVRWYNTLFRIRESCQTNQEQTNHDDSETELKNSILYLQTHFEEAMDDDFNTAKVVGILFELAREWNRLLDEKKSFSMSLCETFFESLKKIHGVLGLFGSNPAEFLQEEKNRVLEKTKLSPEEIEKKIQERNEARKKKDWKLADEIRNSLLELGIQLKDNPDGTTTWR